jgi:hypothetical protein
MPIVSTSEGGGEAVGKVREAAPGVLRNFI